MIRRNHSSREAAIREAMGHGYWPTHRRDGMLVLSNGKQQVALQRERMPRSLRFHLVEDFPEDTRGDHEHRI